MLRAKGLARAILVSDAVALTGMPPGFYDAPIGGRVELTPEGRLGVVGTPFLAGAVASLPRAVGIAMRDADLSLAAALALAADNPRTAFGLPGLVPGAPADLLRFRLGGGRLVPETTYVAGEPFPAADERSRA